LPESLKMLRSRVIPFLLVDEGRLVKTTKFSQPKYVGDPLNAVRIFNEKQVDELFVADISASRQGRKPDFALLERLSAETRMPLAYAGGVREPSDFERLVGIGVEKVGVSSAYLRNPSLVTAAAQAIGSQSVAVVIDAVRSSALASGFVAFDNSESAVTERSVLELAIKAEQDGAGELILNSVDHDGTMAGFDEDLVKLVRDNVGIAMTIVGGAGSRADLKQLSRRFGPIGIGAGSLFVFTGKFRSVLIQYLNSEEKFDTVRDGTVKESV